jgi:hypothetical protein
MRRRPLPSPAETADILARKRSRPPRRPPPAAGRALTGYLKVLEAKFGKGSGLLIARWPEIVADKRLVRFTEPVKLIKQRAGGAILEIRVDGPAAALIQHQAEDILARANMVLGAGSATRLRIVQGPVKARTTTDAAPKRRRGSGPLDAGTEAALAESLSAAPDGPLKASLLKLGRAVLRG